ncbi:MULTISPECIES: hypothetical protein [Vibrio]|uniref:HEAT repeat domain-containing protein n=1 Tax=Vibrio halioticoli NBRC 102217 TaxID=1219072 RepID=V5FQS7_9VIBR|nr:MULTISPECIES: hypothetical protein [Vibrio]MPW38083.1 hypothetical protein [Vibrio sp. B1Z05]GAD91042.1 hypothetical protein VHA01S_066_00040 [Vibrio halioticoli NBRC 102217]
MHKRLLVILLSVMLSGLSMVQAVELTQQQKQQMLADTQSHDDAQRIVALALSDQSDKANFDLLRIKQPQQEVVRFLAIKSIAENHPQYTSDLAVFVDSQRKVPSSLTLVEQGDGFRFSSPAFAYQQLAQRLMDDWDLNEQEMNFYIAVENGKLNLRTWLTENPELTSPRERLLIENVVKLSEDGMSFLAQQVTTNNVVSWLPSTEVMVAIASASHSPELYNILWKMKTNSAVNRELERLGADGSEFSIQQLILASSNPSLNKRSLQLLAKYAPTSQPAEDFLVSKMNNRNDAQVISTSIQEYGYSSWFKQWVIEHPELFNH